MEEGASPAILNTGVLIFPYSTAARLFFERWTLEQEQKYNQHFQTNWPGEQGVIERMLNITSRDPTQCGIRPLPSTGLNVGIIHARTMNTPNGKYIQHLWRGPCDSERRRRGQVHGRYDNCRRVKRDRFGGQLSKLSINTSNRLNEVLAEIRDLHYEVIDIPSRYLKMV
jgi:hypothetical protein